MKTVGILGTGRMGVRLAEAFAKSGTRVLLGSRDPRRAERISEGLNVLGITPTDYQQATQGDFVLPAMFLRDGMIETLRPYRKHLEGKIVIDISNPFNGDYTDFILPWDTSGAEELQRHFPEWRIVGAFKNVWW